jgi:hypothetical protein
MVIRKRVCDPAIGSLVSASLDNRPCKGFQKALTLSTESGGLSSSEQRSELPVLDIVMTERISKKAQSHAGQSPAIVAGVIKTFQQHLGSSSAAPPQRSGQLVS